MKKTFKKPKSCLLTLGKKSYKVRLISRLFWSPEMDSGFVNEWFYALHTKDAGRVAELLVESPTLINAIYPDGPREGTALHWAALKGHEKVMSQLLLVASPTLINAANGHSWTALHCAAFNGHEKVVSQLLEASPTLVDAVDDEGETALHVAVRMGNEQVVSRLLDVASPTLIKVVNHNGWTALHYAAYRSEWSQEVIVRLWRLNPGSLCIVNARHETPFDIAVQLRNNYLVELWQGSLPLDDVFHAFIRCKNTGYMEQLRPKLETQCEGLLGWLNQDVVGLVSDYLGFHPQHRTHPAERTH